MTSLCSALPAVLLLAALLSVAIAQDCAIVDPRCVPPPLNAASGSTPCLSCGGTFSACGVMLNSTDCAAFCSSTVALWAVHAMRCGVHLTGRLVRRARLACLAQCARTNAALATANAARDPGDPGITKAMMYVVCSPTDTFSDAVMYEEDKACNATSSAPAVVRNGREMRLAARETEQVGKSRAGRSRQMRNAVRQDWYDDDYSCLSENDGPRIVASYY